MSSSLRDQLIKAGLVSQKEVRQAEKQLRKQRQQQPKSPPNAAARAQAAKIARDRELNRRLAAKAEKKARDAQIRQIIEQHQLPRSADGAPYHFRDGAQIKRVYVDAEQRAQLIQGGLAIARFGSGFALLPLAAAERIRERDPRAIVDFDAGGAAAQSDEDDAYKGFEVPDDLVW